MWGRLVTKLVIVLLKDSRLDNEHRQLLTAALLDRLGALPINAKVVIDDVHKVFINGRPITLNAAKKLHEGSKAMVKNFARKVVREQVTFMAVHKGVHENISPEQGLFAKAALWVMQEEDELYRRFAAVEVAEGDQ